MTKFEDELRNKMKANLLLNKEEMMIKDRLLWNINERCIKDDDLITSQKFSALLKRCSEQKLVCTYDFFPKIILPYLKCFKF